MAEMLQIQENLNAPRMLNRTSRVSLSVGIATLACAITLTFPIAAVRSAIPGISTRLAHTPGNASLFNPPRAGNPLETGCCA